MQIDTKIALRTDMAAAVIAAHRNPNDWNTALRGVAERLGLNPARIEFHAAIVHTVFSIVEEASKQSQSPDAVRAAIELVNVEANPR